MEEKIKNKIEKIRELLEVYNNPIYFFDNDVDGLASFLLLRKYSGKGKAVAIKSFPELNANYLRKINELQSDCVFVLDKPVIAKAFIDGIMQRNLMFSWIDHHKDNKGFKEYEGRENYIFLNPTIEINENKPTTYWAYKIVGGIKEYNWIAALGCLADWYVPDFIDEVYEKYPDLFEIGKEKINDVSKILYETTFGKIILMLNFGLKDTTTNIVRMTKFLAEIKSPYEILEKNEKNKTMHRRFNQIYKIYSKLIEKAKNYAKSDVLFFQYGGNVSISAEISNALLYKYPKKVIVVAYLKGDRAKISIRAGFKIREAVLKALEGIEDATGGGHDYALGANVRIEDLPLFKERLIKEIRKIMK